MARNKEKQLGRLNRIHLQKLHEDELKKRPPRPKLNDLFTAEDIKKWLPSIKEDINYYIAQSAVPCYPQKQIEEFNRRIDKLHAEYNAFVKKLKFLDPDIKTTPWTNRPYSSHKRSNPDNNKPENEQKKSKLSADMLIPTPVLDNDIEYRLQYGYLEETKPIPTSNLNIEIQDQPLLFDPIKMPASTVAWSRRSVKDVAENLQHSDCEIYNEENNTVSCKLETKAIEGCANVSSVNKVYQDESSKQCLSGVSQQNLMISDKKPSDNLNHTTDVNSSGKISSLSSLTAYSDSEEESVNS